jgi:hypothetical protein
MYNTLIEIDQIILPMIIDKQTHMEEEIKRLERMRVRKARKHRIDDWEDKDLEALSDDS